jgi:hypothetical protein
VSIEAVKWAVEYAPPMPSQLVATLTGLAYHADKQGRGAYPSVPRLAAYACKDKRSVQRDLKQLRELDLIRLGDQSLAAHLPAGKRPEVYDLAIERTVPGGRAADDEVTSTSRVTLASSRRRGGRKKPTSDTFSSPSWGDVDVTGDVGVTGDVDVADGVTSTSQKGWRGRHPNLKEEPSVEPKDSCPPPEAASDSTPGLFAVPDPGEPPAPAADNSFDTFWAHYPRKEGKVHARKAYAAAIKRGMTADKLLAALQIHIANWQAKRKGKEFIPHPTTWLNGERYNDELPSIAESLAPTGTDGHPGPWRNYEDQDIYDRGWNGI